MKRLKRFTFYVKLIEDKRISTRKILSHLIETNSKYFKALTWKGMLS